MNFEQVACQLTEEDWDKEAQAFSKAVEEMSDGESVAWDNPATGNSGVVTPLSRFSGTGGEPCRKFRESFKSKNYDSKYTVSVRKMADGEWKVLKVN